jgi:hypothetical protein
MPLISTLASACLLACPPCHNTTGVR